MNDAFNQKLKYLKILSKNLFLIADLEDFNSFDAFLNAVASACLVGVQIILYRDNKSSDKEYISNAKKIKLLCDEFGVTFLVNNRPDIAFSLQADGVLLGQNDIDIYSAREILGQNSIIGSACSSLVQINYAISQGADFFVVYDSPSLDKHAVSLLNIKTFLFTNSYVSDEVFSTELLPILNFNLITSMAFDKLKKNLLNKI